MSEGNNKASVDEILRGAQRDKFWGDITLTYRDGVPTLARKIETIPLDGRTANVKAGQKNPSS